MKLTRSLVISIFLYTCGSGTFTAELEKGRHSFEKRCKLLATEYIVEGPKNNEEVRRKI